MDTVALVAAVVGTRAGREVALAGTAVAAVTTPATVVPPAAVATTRTNHHNTSNNPLSDVTAETANKRVLRFLAY